MKPNGPGQSPWFLSEVVRELEGLSIDYAVVGALAASFHGVVRASLDADAVIFTGGNSALLQALIARLRARGWQVDYRRGDFKDPVDSVVAVTDQFENRVDLLTGIRGLSSDCLSRAIEAKVARANFKMIGAEDFVALKLFAGGPTDLQDALGVMKVSAGSIDRTLLKRLAAQYGPEVSRKLKNLMRIAGDAGGD